ncbi:MAG: hypothetical protein WAW37_00850 [Syntrophobacteraceae bacterium]
MLPEAQIHERAEYCYCVFMQLSWLYGNHGIEPARYLERLRNSTLDLATDAFVVMTIEEALMEGRPDGGLLSLLALYEGFTHAFCEVLETTMDEVGEGIPPELLQKLAEEMGVEAGI